MEFEHFNDSEIKVWCVKNIAENAFCPFRSFWSLKPWSFQVSYNPVSFPVLISIRRYFYHLSPLVPLFALRIRFHNLFFLSTYHFSVSGEIPSFRPPSSLHWSINPSSPGSTYCWQLLPLFPYSSPLYTGYLTSFNPDESKRRLYISFHWVEEKTLLSYSTSLFFFPPLACFFASLMKLIWLKVEQFHSSPLVPHFLGNILPASSL